MINLKLKSAEAALVEPAAPLSFDPAESARTVYAGEAVPIKRPADPKSLSGGQPRVLLLQGPVGPFFGRLQRRLRAGGFDVRRVCFNAGDRLFAGDPGATLFSDTLDEWPAQFAAILEECRPHLVVLFGAERPIHAAARDLSRAAGVPVLCLEEGYIRPGWITAELDGNNAASPQAGRLPPPSWAPSEPQARDGTPRRSFRQSCLYAFAYYGVQAMLNSEAERSLLHRSVRTGDSLYFARNVLRKLTHSLPDAVAIRRLEQNRAGRYGVVALQMPGDSQLGAAARGWTNERLVDAALAALADVRNGTVERLVFKIHPLDRGRAGLARAIRQRARYHGVADSADVLHCGPAGTVIRHSAGLITINSTAGLSAIFHGVPLVAVGRALYGHPALALSGGREAIEALLRGEAHPPEADLRQRYLAFIREKCLLKGDFYSGRGAAEACDNLAEMVAALCLPASGCNCGTN